MAEGEGEDDDSSKTEEPTQKKLDDAREKGQVAQSKEMSTWLILLMITLIIGVGTPPLFDSMKIYLANFFEKAGQVPTGIGGISAILTDMMLHILGYVGIPFLLLMPHFMDDVGSIFHLPKAKLCFSISNLLKVNLFP
jgi:flagellar biosynthetic protein FlhB